MVLLEKLSNFPHQIQEFTRTNINLPTQNNTISMFVSFTMNELTSLDMSILIQIVPT